MRKESRSVCMDTLEQLFRDLHVAVTLMHDDPSNRALIRRYIGTVDLIWDSITGMESLAFTRPHVFCEPITEQEVNNARGS